MAAKGIYLLALSCPLQMPERCLKLLADDFVYSERGDPIAVKGKGLMQTVFIESRRIMPSYSVIAKSDIGGLLTLGVMGV